MHVTEAPHAQEQKEEQKSENYLDADPGYSEAFPVGTPVFVSLSTDSTWFVKTTLVEC